MMKFITPVVLLLLFLTACGQNDNNSATTTSPSANEAVNNETFTYEDIPGSDTKRAYKKGVGNTILEEGFMRNGQKTGLWCSYKKQYIFPDQMVSYENGMRNGPYYEFTERGTVTLKANYLNNKLHGYWATFKFSKPTAVANYVNGQLDGAYQEFDDRNNYMTVETMYKNGKQDGHKRFFDENGKITMEYEYKNGEKVSGGIVK